MCTNMQAVSRYDFMHIKHNATNSAGPHLWEARHKLQVTAIMLQLAWDVQCLLTTICAKLICTLRLDEITGTRSSQKDSGGNGKTHGLLIIVQAGFTGWKWSMFVLSTLCPGMCTK